MKHFIVLIMASVIIVSCQRKYEKQIHYPSNTYEHTVLDTTGVVIKQDVYVPIYSHIYSRDGKTTLGLTATLSIRSMDFGDSLYITKADYYGSDGKLIKKYIDSTLLLKPMNSIEFIVEEEEDEGGAGANFIVEWCAKKQVMAPLIQAVMLSTFDRSGISFVVDGVPLQK
jgi:hypothetical protein